MVFYCFLNVLLPALTSLFDEADTSNDGKISIDEYLQLTKNYGIEVPFFKIFIYSPVVQDHCQQHQVSVIFKIKYFQLTEEDIRHLMEEVADANGELSKSDFILHVKVGWWQWLIPRH